MLKRPAMFTIVFKAQACWSKLVDVQRPWLHPLPLFLIRSQLPYNLYNMSGWLSKFKAYTAALSDWAEGEMGV